MTLQATAGPTATEGYFRLVGQALGDRRQGRLRHQMAFQYPAIDFKGRSVLDVGGGDGIHSFYAAARGASKVVNLEPESDGSTAGVTNQFGRWKTALGASNVQLNLGTFQSFDPQGQTFDIVLIQDAINHLDEDACITVRTSPSSRASYESVFKKLAALVKKGGTLHFSDCSSRNLFPALGMSNPFDPAIEWHKHQPPGVWISMLDDAGFSLVSKRWSTPARLGSLGQALFGNGAASYFFTSHFAVTMTRR